MDRARYVEEYAAHLLQNHRDRQCDAAFHAQSVQGRAASLAGESLSTLSQSLLLIRSDGLDQAKHRVPRVLQKTKALENVIRPALHIQMCWMHGYDVCFHVADPDMRKDTVVHVETLARGLSRIYDKLQSLPRHMVLILDNTSSNNKNQLMLKFWLKLQMLKVLETAYVAFPIKGHTHGPLDGLGGHAVVRTSNATFDTAAELTSIYDDFMKKAEFESGTLFRGAEKLDEAADWLSWMEEVPLKLALITGTEGWAKQLMLFFFYLSCDGLPILDLLALACV